MSKIGNRSWEFWYGVLVLVGVIGLVMVGLVWSVFLAIPSSWQDNLPQTIEIPEGVMATEVVEILAEHNLVFSKLALHFAIVWQGGENSVKAGTYYLNQNRDLTTWRLARVLIAGIYNLPDRWVTLYEGMSVKEMVQQFDSQFFPKFNADTFIKLAKGKEGYLFPDSYRFAPNTTAELAIKKISDNFTIKMAELDLSQSKTFVDLDKLLIFASIIEWEANNTDSDRKMVAGILWNRLQKEMPLQVDATLKYVNGKRSDELTVEDLQDNHPYNTYVNLGLPPTPISNPGLKAIAAAMLPYQTNNLYYLHDSYGTPYYAETFDGHKANRVRAGV